jgi:hypothetical protein
LFPLTGNGTGMISYTVYPNYSTRVKSMTATINNTTVVFEQDPARGTFNERFTGQLYSSFFGRPASRSEIDFHVAEALNRGVPRWALVMNFLNSDEFANAGLFIAGLYIGLLNRDADYDGWLFQRNALATGISSPQGLIANFIDSPEFRITYGNLSDPAFIALLYRNILRREGTPSEIAFQANALRSAGRPEMARRFLTSSEFRSNSGSRMLAFLMFATLLQRGPAPAELAERITQIEATGSAQSVIEAFLGSTEFALLLN